MIDISRAAVQNLTCSLFDDFSNDCSGATDMLLALLARVEELERAVARKDEVLKFFSNAYIGPNLKRLLEAINYTGTENE